MNTKEKFLKTSALLFRSYGYSGTGLKKIVAESGAAWGSMYHFFPGGKEQLGVESVLYAGEISNQDFKKIFAKTDNPTAAIRAIFIAESYNMKKNNFIGGCAVAAVAADVASSSEKVRSACFEVFNMWESTIAEMLQKYGIKTTDSESISSLVLSALEGATLLSQTYRSTKPLLQAMEMIDLSFQQILLRTNQSTRP